MDRAKTLIHLAQAERHVAQGEDHIRRQKRIVAEMESNGHEFIAAEARSLLQLFEESQALHLADQDRLRKALADMPGNLRHL